MIDIVDTEEKIRAFLPVLDSMMLRVLITLEKVQVLMFGQDVKHPSARHDAKRAETLTH
jgi:uncharacterized protein